MAASPPDLHDLACVVYLHSTYSDGTATVPELVESARASGRDVVMLTDHDTLAAKRDGFEGWHDGVLLLVGVEVSPHGGHLLAFGLEEEIDPRGKSEAEIASAVAEAVALGFVAHPFSEGARISSRRGKPHGWPDLDGTPFTGIELWSLTTDAAEGWRGVREAFAYLSDPERHLDGPPAHHIEAWDRLCRSRRVVAIGGLDAHQHGVRLPWGRFWSPMRNERYFALLATHLLLRRPPSGELGPDRAQIHEALREGRCYLGVDAIRPAGGFRFWAEGDEIALMGEERPAGAWTLRLELPATARLRLLRDGVEVEVSTGRRLEHRAHGPGVFRVEAWLEWRGRERPWIISNPIYLR